MYYDDKDKTIYEPYSKTNSKQYFDNKFGKNKRKKVVKNTWKYLAIGYIILIILLILSIKFFKIWA